MRAKDRDPDAVGLWTKEKLEALRKYLSAYTTVMAAQTAIRGYHYIDAFAGASKWRIRDTQEFIDGSPRVALGIERPFHSYTFIELDAKRVAQLEPLRALYPDRTIRVLQGDANQLLSSAVAPIIRWSDYQRGIAFLDPYTTNLDFTTLRALGATGTIEVFVNVPTMAINRRGFLNNARDIPEADAQRMERFWGDPDWRGAVYADEVQLGLFGADRQPKIEKTTAKRIGRLYKARLHEAGFPCVSEPSVVENDTGQPIYCLIFAGPNKAGLEIAGHVLAGMGRYINCVP